MIKKDLQSNDPSLARDYVNKIKELLVVKMLLRLGWSDSRCMLYMLGQLIRKRIYKFKKQKDSNYKLQIAAL